VLDAGRDAGARLWRRDALAAGAALAGPSIVLDEGATLWVPGGWRGRVHGSGAVVLRRR
jgi:N-methylhydantoinase A/oxoprolinase/acetone carboxylase beta subunit